MPNLNFGLITFTILCLFQVNSSVTKDKDLNKVNIIVLSCNFSITLASENMGVYVCNLYNLNITTNQEIKAFNGTHLPGKTDSDVEQIHFQNGTMHYIPNGIGTFFKHLTQLLVGDESSLTCLSTKAVTRLSFTNLRNLEVVSLVSKDIQKMDKDALWDLSSLKVFRLNAQRLNFLNVRTFERNTKLMEVAVCSTELRVLYQNIFRYNYLLESILIENNVIETIPEGTFKKNGQLRILSLRSNKLKVLPMNLFENNSLLSAVDFGDNNLESIKIDFTKFKEIQHIGFEDNDCIDLSFEKTRNSTNRHGVIFENVTHFQELLKANCV